MGRGQQSMKYYSTLVFLSFFFLLTLSVPPYLFIYSDGNLIEGVIMVLAQTKKKKKREQLSSLVHSICMSIQPTRLEKNVAHEYPVARMWKN